MKQTQCLSIPLDATDLFRSNPHSQPQQLVQHMYSLSLFYFQSVGPDDGMKSSPNLTIVARK